MSAMESIDLKAFNKALIVGLGKTGLSCARFLAQQGYQVAVIDSRETPPCLDELRESVPNAAVFLGGFDPQVFAMAETIVLSPGVSPNEPLVVEALARKIPVIGDIEIFAHYARAPVIGITGSNGKSTVTTLVADMLKAAGYQIGVGGNLGTPALELLSEAKKDYFVLELSSFQLETTHTLNCAASVILNLSPDHIDRHGALISYAQAKLRITHGTGWVVINDDETLPVEIDCTGRKVMHYGLSTNEKSALTVGQYQGEEWIIAETEPVLPVSQLKLRGRHNLSNILAALSLVKAVGVSLKDVIEPLKAFTGLPHRMQAVTEQNGIHWINDSKATNVGATIAALSGLDGKSVLIAGGQGKGADFSPLKEVIQAKARAVVLLGEDAQQIAAAIGDKVPVVCVTTMREAVKEAAQLAVSGDNVLLSPACASFDMFSSYENRGNVFVSEVHALATEQEVQE